MLQDIKMAILGGVGGLMVSGGVFTALFAPGLVPRFAGKTQTAQYILKYEDAVILGCILGGILSIFPFERLWERAAFMEPFFTSNIWRMIAGWGLSAAGFFSGCFIGCVALAIAEMLDSIPIFARRIGFRKGLGIAVLSVALGKIVGSLLYFGMRIYVR